MTRSLQRLIHVGARDLGLDAETRRDLQLQVVGKASLSDMTDAEMDKVLDALKARGFKPTAKGPKSRPRADRADVRYAHVLWRLLAQAGEARQPGAAGLNAFIRARFGAAWGAVPIDIDTMTDHARIRTVIEALQQMCRRAGIDPERKG